MIHQASGVLGVIRTIETIRSEIDRYVTRRYANVLSSWNIRYIEITIKEEIRLSPAHIDTAIMKV
jgi:type III secretory pathway component EscV